MALGDLLSSLGEDVNDPEEESFLLFSQKILSCDLGFVDAKATSMEITVSGRDLNIRQSPTLLLSNRKGGTTGAVVWKITPLFAQWITSHSNIFFRSSILNKSSIVLELGSGVSGIVAITLAHRIGRYIATDQEYVFRLLKANLEENRLKGSGSGSGSGSSIAKHHGKAHLKSKIEVLALDWESSLVSSLPTMMGTEVSQVIDVVIACDCIYNESLINPFVRTCADICQLANACSAEKPTLCIVAQQLRSDMVFEAWLKAFHKLFKVWRMPDDLLIDGLKEGSGFVVHIGILRTGTNSH
ncbi:MAG: hypothetical protein Q9175_004329 [Cornicularia normoerica]